MQGSETATPSLEGGIGELVLLGKGEHGEAAVAMLAEEGLDLVPRRAGRPAETRDMGFLDFTHPCCPITPRPRKKGKPHGYAHPA